MPERQTTVVETRLSPGPSDFSGPAPLAAHTAGQPGRRPARARRSARHGGHRGAAWAFPSLHRSRRNPDFLRLWASRRRLGLGSQITLLALRSPRWRWAPARARWAGSRPPRRSRCCCSVCSRAPGSTACRGARSSSPPTSPAPPFSAAIPVARFSASCGSSCSTPWPSSPAYSRVVSEVAHASYLPAIVGREQLVEGNSKLAVAGSRQRGRPRSAARWCSSSPPRWRCLRTPSRSSCPPSSWGRSAARSPPRPRRPRRRRCGARSAKACVRRAHPVLRTLTGAFGLYFLFDALFWGLYPLYVTRELGSGPADARPHLRRRQRRRVLGALFVEPVTRRFGLGPALAGALLVGALGELCIPLAGGPVLVACPCSPSARCWSVSSDWVFAVNFASLRQAPTPDRLQGRVNATVRVFTSGRAPGRPRSAGSSAKLSASAPRCSSAAGVLLPSSGWSSPRCAHSVHVPEDAPRGRPRRGPKTSNDPPAEHPTPGRSAWVPPDQA